MKLSTPMKKIIFLVLIVLMVLISFYFFVIEVKNNSSKAPKPPFNLLPTPTIVKVLVEPNKVYPPIPGQSKEYKKSAEEIEATIAPQIKQDSLIGSLLNKLPYYGNNFSMNYDFNNNQFTVIIKIDKKTEGDKEFNEFLKENKILDKSWFNNLTILYK